MQHPSVGTFGSSVRTSKASPQHAVSAHDTIGVAQPHKNATSIVMIEVALYFCVYVNYVNLYLKIDYKIRLVVVACALVV
jgi:hypothetical protein